MADKTEIINDNHFTLNESELTIRKFHHKLSEIYSCDVEYKDGSRSEVANIKIDDVMGE